VTANSTVDLGTTDRAEPRHVVAVPGGGVVAVFDVGLDAGRSTRALLARFDASLAPVGPPLELAPDADTSAGGDVAVLADGSAVAVVAAGPASARDYLLVRVTGDELETVDLPDDGFFFTGAFVRGLAVDPAGAVAYVPATDRASSAAALVAVDLATGSTTRVAVCEDGAATGVVLDAQGTAAFVSGDCDPGGPGGEGIAVVA
jgi:hypothetical protein